MNFWKSFGASMLAIGICTVVAIIFLVSFIISLASSFEPELPTTKPDTILYIGLDEDVTDSPGASAIGSFDASSMSLYKPLTLLEMLAAIEHAATDDRIKGICIQPSGSGNISVTNIEELRQALYRFKLSGKFIIAYDEIYTESDYYLATVADMIIMQPEGNIDFHGIGTTSIFFKGLMDRIGAKVEVFRPTDCKFKSAVEPYIRTNMSPENRAQMNGIVTSMWNDIVSDIALSRNLDATRLKDYARNLTINTAEDALNAGMIDMIGYEDELFAMFDKYGVVRNSHGLHNGVSLGDYASEVCILRPRVSTDDDSALSLSGSSLIAIIYAEGQIVDGDEYVDGYVYGSRLAAELRHARLDDRCKAVVVRVNSPGGSAIASDVAWREMELLQQTKPVVISMGEMAASGGYYISAPADYIYANKLTLTGSIGVFSVIFNLETTLKDMAGITTDSSLSAPSAGGLGYLTPMTTEQKAMMSKMVDKIYDTFTSHVAEGRNLAIEDVLKVAEGRVWSGSDAVGIGLVDAIGGINEAIIKAAELADVLNNFELYEYSAPMTPFELWVESMGLVFAQKWGISHSLYGQELCRLFTEFPQLITNHGIQALVPGDLKVEF